MLKADVLTQFLWLRGMYEPLKFCVNVLFLGENIHSFSQFAKGV